MIMHCPRRPLYIVSACLVGLCTRYDGKETSSEPCRRLLVEAVWIPICPEQLGGLSTHRPAAELVGGDGSDVLRGTARVLTKDGADVTAAFVNGALQVLAIARSQPIDAVLLKSHSPSCGRTGVTTALLAKHGFCLQEF